MCPQQSIDSFLNEPLGFARLNEWLFENIAPYIKGRVLEIGSGSGVISALFVEKNIPVHLSDANSSNCNNLRIKFEGLSVVRHVHNFNFSHPDFDQLYSSAFGVFDTVVALNVTEKRYYNKSDLQNVGKLVRRHGRLIMITPSHTAFPSDFEQDLEQLKKYNWKSLKELLGDYEILKTRYFKVLEHLVSVESIALSVLVVARKN